MFKINKLLIALTIFSSGAFADQTGPGKIIYTQGHNNPSCRMVKHKETATGIERIFRIQDVATHDDVGGVVLAALLANRDVVITFDPAQLSGCGSEPKILNVIIY